MTGHSKRPTFLWQRKQQQKQLKNLFVNDSDQRSLP